MKNLLRKYCLATSLILAADLYGQDRTIIEFYGEVPAISDFLIDFKPQMSAGVIVQADGWKIPPGHQVKIELPYVLPESAIAEVRLGFAWEGRVVTGVFEGWSQERLKYRVFEETLYPHETQKRIFPMMRARNYEFRVKCNPSLRQEQRGLILQTLVIYWVSVAEKE